MPKTLFACFKYYEIEMAPTNRLSSAATPQGMAIHTPAFPPPHGPHGQCRDKRHLNPDGHRFVVLPDMSGRLHRFRTRRRKPRAATPYAEMDTGHIYKRNHFQPYISFQARNERKPGGEVGRRFRYSSDSRTAYLSSALASMDSRT